MKMNAATKTKLTRTAQVFFIIIGIALAALYAYVRIQNYPADEEYLARIEANEMLEITEKMRLYIVTPANANPDNPAIIFYPGGLVDPQAYLFKMGHAAKRLQTTVYIIRAPFNAAIFDIDAATRIIDSYSLEQYWVGGHSLGGIAAARYTAKNKDTIEGLFLFGSYSDRNLNDFEGAVVSIMGLEDMIIDRSNYEEAKSNLPAHARIIEIDGLNHSDFGNYGLQNNDGQSRLTETEIIELISGHIN